MLTAEAGTGGAAGGAGDVRAATAGPAMANPRAERVRAVRRLADAPGRRRAGAFLVEGPQAVREALAEAVADAGGGGRPGVREAFLTEAAAHRHPELPQLAARAGVPLRWCTEEVLAAMADTTTPQGVVAVADLRDVPLAVALGRRPAPQLVAVLASVRDPGNAGTVLRAADAAGAGAVVLTAGSTDAAGPKCVRAAAGSTFHLDVVQGPPLADVAEAARGAGLALLATDGSPGAGSADLDDLLDDAAAGTGPLAGPVAWVFGNEAHGLTAAERAACDLVVRVPLHGRAESLNLAAAAAVCLYASARGQRRRASPAPAGARGAQGPAAAAAAEAPGPGSW
jgi:TrmH family RNA methyltransferase